MTTEAELTDDVAAAMRALSDRMRAADATSVDELPGGRAEWERIHRLAAGDDSEEDRREE